MIDYLFASILWALLIGIDLIISTRLALMYRKDHDLQKLMFGIGLLFVMQTYIMVICGLETSFFSRKVFEWCSLPILFAFILSTVNTKFKLCMSKCFGIFLTVTTITIMLFFIPINIPSLPVLLTALFFALIFTSLQLSKEFDFSRITLVLSLPSFAICYSAIELKIVELAIFSAFVAKAFLLLSFGISKRQTGTTTSFLVLQKELNGTKQDLARIQEKLLVSERLATVGQLSTILAHDLRNPLQGITTGIFCLRRSKEIAENSKIQYVLQNMEDAVNYSERIVKGLLDYSENIELEIRETTPQFIITKALSLMKIPKSIQIINHVLSTPKIYVDIDRLVRACEIIIENAFDAMPEGGTLTITSKEIKSSVEFSFKDTGKGIKKEILNQLTTPFFTTKAKGMGLGLAICRKLINSHSGNLHAISEIGKGAIFIITIPKVNNSKSHVNFLIKETKQATVISTKRVLKGGISEN